MQHDAFRAVQDPGGAGLARGRGHVGQVVARLALDMGEGELQLARRDLRHQRAALGARCGAAQQAAAQDDGGEIGFQHQAAAEGFHDQGGFNRAATEAAEVSSNGRPSRPISA